MKLNKEPQIHQIRSDQSLSRVQLFATPWITAHQASLSIVLTNSLEKFAKDFENILGH